MSKLDNYKDKAKTIKYRQDYNKANYKSVYLQLHKVKDAEMLEELNNAKSKSQLVRKWYKKSKDKTSLVK